MPMPAVADGEWWNLLGLKQKDPPVGGLELQHIGLLLVVLGLDGQGVVHTNGILQVVLRQSLLRLVLILQREGKKERAKERERKREG